MKFNHESAAQWSERAIVADSLAASREESYGAAANPEAIKMARLRAGEAATELQTALEALRQDRRQAQAE